MKKFLIHTMGCKTNKFESSVIRDNLIEKGLEEVKNPEDADIYVLNSCTVTHKSDNEALYLLRSVKHKNPNILTVLTGCLAQIKKENLLKNDFIDFVVGNDEKLELFKYIQSDVKCSVSDIMSLSEFHKASFADTTQTRAGIKIQDGCDNRCSYCIIPFARGKSRSADKDFIISMIKNFERKKFNEIVFTGIHIGLWGKEHGESLLDLLNTVEKETSISRYRLGSLYPNEITDEMLEFLSKSDKFCPHFHLSLQSGCNKTLKSMNRCYSVEDYLTLIKKINVMFKLPFIGSDIIAGFADETEEDFEITVKNLKKSGLSQIHTFPYSRRFGTVGAAADGQLSDNEKNRRADIIKKISKEKYHEFITENIAADHEVLIEKRPDKNTGMLKGITRNYLTVFINSRDLSLTNSLQRVKLVKYNGEKIYGELYA